MNACWFQRESHKKTFSEQETFGSDRTDEAYVEATLRRMADCLFAKVREEGRSIRTETVKVPRQTKSSGTLRRGRRWIEIFSTDKHELRENVIRSGDRELALELAPEDQRAHIDRGNHQRV